MNARKLIIVLGDQLDLQAAAFDDLDPALDVVWMAEVDQESTHVWSTKPRIAMFLAAMRHFEQALLQAGYRVHYRRLDDPDNTGTLAGELERAVRAFSPDTLVMTAPGDWRVLASIKDAARTSGVPLDIRPDRHFFSTVREFAAYIRQLNGKPLRMEYFYRDMRRRHQVLMGGDEPLGAQWNFDKSNRHAFGRAGPGRLPERSTFEPDAITQEVLQLVQARFADHPGALDSFAWPVTPQQAREALKTFVADRLPLFGHYQDAIWPGEPWLYHSQLSAALNLKLIDPRTVVAAVEQAHHDGHVPLASAEGYIRQILGWREYVRGVYWTQMPGYLTHNVLAADQDLPDWYWTADTDFECLHQTIDQTLAHGYAHHIQRLMVTGVFAMMFGVRPKAIHEWYLAVYVDAVEWVELPNTLGMSQYGDGGLITSKPYIATGKYIQRMGGPCASCRYDPGQATGESACPFTTLHWDFLMRHTDRLRDQQRVRHAVARLDTFSAETREAIRARARAIQANQVGSGRPPSPRSN